MALGSYERLGDQFQDSRNAARILSRNMRGLGQTEDLGSKIKLVANAVAAGASALETPAPASGPAVSVDIPYVPIGLGILAVVAVFYFLKKKK